MRFDRLLLVSTALTAVAVPTYAQTTDPTASSTPTAEAGATLASDTADANAENAAEETIIVTGSRIRRPNIESAVPVTSVTAEEFQATGLTSVGDVLNELPALRSTFSAGNSQRFIGTSGLNILDLRGLGTQRTLVLQNGRRHVPAALAATGTEVDVNQIPTDLIERVDVVTGGNSAIYGSDAIAGVVNFVLKQDFEGIQVRGQAGTSKYGDAESYLASALAGTNFGDGRGNIAVALEYARQNPFYSSDRPTTRNRGGFVLVDADPAGTPNGSDGVPDRVYVPDIRSTIYSEGGTVEDFRGATPVPYIFLPDGTLVAQNLGLRDFRPRANSTYGGNGSTFQSYRDIFLTPRQERFAANLLAHYEISEALVPFIEAKFVRNEVFGGSAGPAFTARGTFFGEVYDINNPFLTDQARSVLRSINPNVDTEGFLLNNNFSQFGTRGEDITRDTYRIVAGLRGDFNDDWSYEISANYGRFEETVFQTGNLNVQRFLLATDAVRNAAGQIVCRAQVDPTAVSRYGLNQAWSKYLAADIAACRPLNVFGYGNMSEEAIAYVTPRTRSDAYAEQFVINGFVSGDTSQFFELPGGPVGFAFGAEYRREKQKLVYDEFITSGVTFLNVIPDYTPPTFEVKELFGELRLPILADRPFFNELTVELAGRVADYKGATGTVYAYNAGLSWAPVQDVRFRGNYSVAVRAPSLVESYGAASQNFANVVDPCDIAQIGAGSATRAANCAAAGAPAGYNFVYTSSLEYRSGGNPDLKEETSKSWTVGGVFQPRFLPGFALTADYYDITVDDVITSPTAQQILNACYDAPDLNNQFCGLFQRDPATFRIVEGSLQATLLNYAKLKVRGVDVEASYRTGLGAGTLDTRLTLTKVIENNEFLLPDRPNYAGRIKSELGDPEWAWNFNLGYDIGKLSFGYQLRYIGKMTIGPAESVYSVQGRDPENADYAEFLFYPDVFYHDLRAGYDFSENVNAYVGIDNVFNRMPPFGLTTVGGGSGIYDIRGRYFYAGAVVKF